MLTFEKLIPIPLVPFARAGVGGDVLFYGNTAGAFVLRFGGGVHYYLLKWLGLGVETNFTFGPGFYRRPAPARCSTATGTSVSAPASPSSSRLYFVRSATSTRKKIANSASADDAPPDAARAAVSRKRR